jgi:zinc protease
MDRRLLLASPLLAIRAFGQAAPKPPAPGTAEAILDRYITVTGGKAARMKARTQFLKTKVSMAAQGISGTATEYRGDGISYVEMEIPGVGKVEQGVYKGVVWEKSALMGPRLKQGDERFAALRQAALDSDWNWRRYYSAELVPADASEAPEPSDKIVLTPKDGGSPETRYYSKKTGLLVKMSTILKSEMGTIPTMTLFSDYRNVGGVLVAFRNSVIAGPQQMELLQETVQNNVVIPPAKRVPPPDVMLLIQKPNTPAKK